MKGSGGEWGRVKRNGGELRGVEGSGGEWGTVKRSEGELRGVEESGVEGMGKENKKYIKLWVHLCLID